MGWNVTILDGDGHKISDLNPNYSHNKSNKIKFGNHVWLASDATILKGVTLGNDVVVASGACVTKSIEENNVLITGTNRITKRNIIWKK